MTERTWIEDVLRGPQGAAGAAGAAGPAGPTGPAGPSGGIADIVIDFADLDTQDLSNEPDGTIVTLSDGSEWMVRGTPDPGHTFGVVNGTGLVFERLGAGALQARYITRPTEDVDPSLYSGARVSALCRTDTAYSGTVNMILWVGYSSDGTTMAGQPTCNTRVESGVVESYMYLNASIRCSTKLSNIASYGGVYDATSLLLGIEFSNAGFQATHTALFTDTTASPLVWPPDTAVNMIGHSSLALASAQGAPFITGTLNGWITDNGADIVRRQQMTAIGFNSTTVRQCICRAVRWTSL